LYVVALVRQQRAAVRIPDALLVAQSRCGSALPKYRRYGSAGLLSATADTARRLNKASFDDRRHEDPVLDDTTVTRRTHHQTGAALAVPPTKTVTPDERHRERRVIAATAWGGGGGSIVDKARTLTLNALPVKRRQSHKRRHNRYDRNDLLETASTSPMRHESKHQRLV